MTSTSHYVIHEFLASGVLRQLVTHFLHRQGLFEVIGREREGVQVLEQLGDSHDLLTAAVCDVLPDVASRCGLAPLELAGIDMRVVSRGNTSRAPIREARVDECALGFVLFLHREPRRFEGGALHLYYPEGEFVIEPSQNSVVFFRTSLAAQLGAVREASSSLIDSRLTLEGSIRATSVGRQEPV